VRSVCSRPGQRAWGREAGRDGRYLVSGRLDMGCIGEVCGLGGIAGALKSSCDRMAVIGVVPVGVLGMKGGANSGGVALSTAAAVMRSRGR
jgi:hypothetical protein